MTTTDGSQSNIRHSGVDMDDKIDNTNEKETTYEVLQRWYHLLFTKEDYLHHHKILGTLCLLSFTFRFVAQFVYGDMGFKAFPYLTLPTMVLHTLLSISSFQFKIPVRRIRDGGRIWPQYRYHSLIFALRSILMIGVYFYEDTVIDSNLSESHPQHRFYFMNYIILMGAMGAAELVNIMVGEEQRSNTIRDLEHSEYVKFVFSTMQFNVMAIFLLGIRYYSIPFYTLFTVQLTPFIGTLRRKAILTSNFWGAFVYASLLMGGFTIQWYSYQLAGGEVLHLFGRNIGLYAALLRFTDVIPKELSIIQSKFVIWTVMYLITNHYRSMDYQNIDIIHLRALLVLVVVLLGLTAHHKVKSGYYPKDVKHAKQMKITDQKSM